MRAARTAASAPAAARRRGPGWLAVLAFACTCAFVVQGPGWAQASYLTLSKAFSAGTPRIDRWHWETHDIAYTDGHYYSVKPPGLALATLPVYEALTALGAERASRVARVRAEAGGERPWSAGRRPIQSYGYSTVIATRARSAIADDAPLTWILGLFGVLLPALVLLVVVARMTDRVAPGYGGAAAMTLATATMILPFATLYFSHVLSALLGFSAFALVWREREGSARAWRLAVAGLLAGLAVGCEYPLAITAIVVAVYALSRRQHRVRRAVLYGAGLAAGVAPLLAYNTWAFGSPLHMSYANAVTRTGFSGHDALGLNDGGLFGITFPRPGDALLLLFSGRGLLTLTPVIVMGIAGVVLMHRDRRHRTEARVIAAIAISYFVYNSGYWLPLGGGSPGPRFLIPVLPFIAVGFGLAWHRWPAVTLALAAVSATTMTAATMAYPITSGNDPGEWLRRLFDDHSFEHSVLDLAGMAHGLPAILPFAGGVALALYFGVRPLGRRQLSTGARHASVAVAIWLAATIVLPKPLRLPSAEAVLLTSMAAAIGLIATAVPRLGGPTRGRTTRPDEPPASAPIALDAQAAQQTR
jgi:hypothetical protein